MQRFWQLFLKSGQTPPLCWREAILVTAVQVKAPLLVRMRTLPRPGCFAAPTAPHSDGRVPGDGEQDGDSRVGRLAMNVILLVKASRIKYFLSTTADCGR